MADERDRGGSRFSKAEGYLVAVFGGFGEAVADASDGFDQVGGVAHLFAKAADVDVDRPFEDHRVFAERGIDQFAPIEGAARLSDQGIEQAEFALGDRDGVAVDIDAKAAAIDGHAGEGDRVPLFAGLFLSPEVCLEPLEEDGVAFDRFDDIIVGADGEADDLVGFFTHGAQHQDQGVAGFGGGAELFTDIDPAHHRKVDIEEDDIREAKFCLDDGICPVRGAKDLVAGTGQLVFERFGERPIVFDDQDFGFGHRECCGRDEPSGRGGPSRGGLGRGGLGRGGLVRITPPSSRKCYGLAPPGAASKRLNLCEEAVNGFIRKVYFAPERSAWRVG